MPQGRRKTPFSGKAKKVQIQQKREKNESRPKIGDEKREDFIPFSKVQDIGTTEENDMVLVQGATDKSDLMMQLPGSTMQSSNKGRGRGFQNDATRFELRFTQETKKEIALKKEKARQLIEKIQDNTALELSINEYFPDSLDFPIRPPWDHNMAKMVMEANEAKYFREYVQSIFDKHEENQLSFFELNLETWRQLWRVIEKSDILLLVVDARYPTAMFPPSLYRYVVSMKKDFILVLNKVDLIPASLALAWKDYFQKTFPEIHITFFTSCPTYNLMPGAPLTGEHAGLKFRRLRGTISMVTDGAKQIFDICKKIIEKDQRKISSVELDSWASKIHKAALGHNNISDKGDSVNETKCQMENEASETLTIGMLGQPNAGKSSLINSLMGKRVVSVSKTPGHTKHFQTIYITKFVVLCDCPGLVFPSLVPKPLQILLGSFPIAQVKEPISVVQYIAERIDLPSVLKILHPDNQELWSAYDICEGWANKRGYITARSNRPDIHRAANHILRMGLEGKFTMSLFPPNYGESQSTWENHPDLKIISELLGTDVISNEETECLSEQDIITDSDEDEGSDSTEKDTTPAISNKFGALTSYLEND